MAGEPNLSQLKVQMDTYRDENKTVYRRLDEKLDKLQSSIDSLTTRFDEQMTWLKEQFGENSEYGPISESFVGVNYGELADNLPPPPATAKLLQSTTIEKVKLYGTDLAIIGAPANTGIVECPGTLPNSIVKLAETNGYKDTSNNHQNYYKLPTVELPVISGDEVKRWIQLCNLFFLFNSMPTEKKVGHAAVHMDELAKSWMQSKFRSPIGLVWNNLRDALNSRFSKPGENVTDEFNLLKPSCLMLEIQAKTEELQAAVLKDWITPTDVFLSDAILMGLKGEVRDVDINEELPYIVEFTIMKGPYGVWFINNDSSISYIRKFFPIVFDPGGIVGG